MITMRLSAFILSFFFIFHTVAHSATYSYTLRVPEERGYISRRFRGKDDRLIIHIQDAHSSLEGQINLARIICGLLPHIESVNEGAKIPFIGIEGATSEYDLKRLRTIPLQEAKEIVGTEFLREGKFIGAEFASMIADRDFSLLGLENVKEFTRNFRPFYRLAGKQEKIEAALSSIEKLLFKMKGEIYNPALFEFDEKLGRYEKESREIDTYLDFLLQASSIQDSALYDYPALLHLYELSKNRAAISREKICFDARRLLQKRKQKRLSAGKSGLRRLLTSYQNGTIDQRSFIYHFVADAKRDDISLRAYPSLKEAASYWRAYALCDPNRILDEMRDLGHEIRIKLAESGDEEDLVRLWEKFYRLKRLVKLQALREDVKTFRSDRHAYRFDSFKTEILRLARKHGICLPSRPFPGVKDSVLDLVDTFYRAADARDEIMLNNLLQAMEDRGQPIGVIVAGGYHSSALSALMKERNISFMTVTPRISRILPRVRYMDRMLGNIVPLHPALSSCLQQSSINSSIQALAGSLSLRDVEQSALEAVLGQCFFNAEGELLEHDEVERRILRFEYGKAGELLYFIHALLEDNPGWESLALIPVKMMPRSDPFILQVEKESGMETLSGDQRYVRKVRELANELAYVYVDAHREIVFSRGESWSKWLERFMYLPRPQEKDAVLAHALRRISREIRGKKTGEHNPDMDHSSADIASAASRIMRDVVGSEVCQIGRAHV